MHHLNIEELAKKAALQDDVQLQPHQQRIIDRMNAGDKRLLLYHGLGSGKSLSSLAAAEAAGGDYGAVTPASLRQNYEKEIEKFTEGTEPDVLSYSGVGAGKQFKKPVKTTIFDEAHRLRNPGTAATQAAKRLAQNSENLLLLTGTPITNHPSDLASLLGLLHNKNISSEQFEKDYVGHKKVYPTFLSRFTGKGVGEQPYVKNEAKLRELLKGKIDYQASKTPEGVNVKEEVVKVPLSGDQQRIQKAIKSGIPPEWAWKLNKEFPLSRDELKSMNSFLTGLRQSSLSTLPFRGDKKPLAAFDESGKLQQALKDLKDELGSDPRKKAITYSNYIDAGLSPYAAALEREKIPYGMFHGGIPLKQRKQTLQDYNEGKLRALLLGPAAAEGISTKGTNLIQLLDPHWHESRSSQARGRGLRFDSHTGLPEDLKNVAVKRYISESKEPSWLGRLLGSQRQRTGDEILQTLAADKEKLNDVFRKILQEEGTPMKTASDSVAYTLQNLVFGCIGLALQFKHCHWNVRGPMFKPLHDFLDEVHETLESTSDDLAERLVTLDHPADGNPSGVASGFDQEVLPLKFMQPATIVDSLTDRLKSLCAEFNVAIKKTSSDPVTSNMLQDMTHKLEKHLWMLRSQKENSDSVEKEAAVKALNFVMGRSWLTVR
jgi:starvation-inducible DNA-binding protein